MPRSFVKTCFARLSGLSFAVAVAVLSFFDTLPAFADGIPMPWGIGLQDPGSPIESRIYSFHTMLMWLVSIICLIVLALMIVIAIRFNAKSNKTPSTRTHNVKLEVIWTVVPILILIGLGAVSFPLLYYTDREPAYDLTLKVTGHQWYWSYEYPDNSDVNFDSHAIWDSPQVTDDQAQKLIADAKTGWLIQNTPSRLLEVDNRVVLPVGKFVRVQITAGDVEHSWFINSLGINRMAVPGRLNELWLKVEKPGIYYGQCSMICGNGHGYMPIVIEGVTQDQFDAWVKAKAPSAPVAAAPAATPAAALVKSPQAAKPQEPKDVPPALPTKAAPQEPSSEPAQQPLATPSQEPLNSSPQEPQE